MFCVIFEHVAIECGSAIVRVGISFSRQWPAVRTTIWTTIVKLFVVRCSNGDSCAWNCRFDVRFPPHTVLPC